MHFICTLSCCFWWLSILDQFFQNRFISISKCIKHISIPNGKHVKYVGCIPNEMLHANCVWIDRRDNDNYDSIEMSRHTLKKIVWYIFNGDLSGCLEISGNWVKWIEWVEQQTISDKFSVKSRNDVLFHTMLGLKSNNHKLSNTNSYICWALKPLHCADAYYTGSQ